MKRTPMKRGKPLERSPFKAKPPAVKQRKCKVKACGTPFMPRRGFQDWCSPECGAVLAQERLEKQRLAEQRRDSAEHRAKLADSKPLSHWLDLTERVVNRFIQVRDRGQPCISCGTRCTVQWEAGHYLSVGARPELRFVAANINLQCHHCNVHKSGNQAAYRIGLVAKIGEAAVEELEGPHPRAGFRRDSLAEIRREFAAATRELERAQRAAANDHIMQEAA